MVTASCTAKITKASPADRAQDNTDRAQGNTDRARDNTKWAREYTERAQGDDTDRA